MTTVDLAQVGEIWILLAESFLINLRKKGEAKKQWSSSEKDGEREKALSFHTSSGEKGVYWDPCLSL